MPAGAKVPVDVGPVLMDYLGSYIHDLQSAISNNSASGLAELKLYMASRQRSTVKVFSLEHFTRESNGTFTAIVKVAAMLGHVTRQVTVTDQTNAGMRSFKLETVQ